MLEITAKNIRTWSRLGPRAVYGMALSDIIEDDARVYALSADLGQSSGLSRLMELHPERYLNLGIAEQNMIGVAGGLAKTGLIPFASSFAPFITLRCADQVRMNLGYMNLNIKLAALSSGCSMGYLGYSHYGIEDLALMRAIPNVSILAPADCGQVVSAVRTAASHDGPVYIRLTGEPGMPAVYQEEHVMTIGGSHVLAEGRDVAFVAVGSMTAAAVKARDILEAEGISCGVVDMYSVKPIHEAALERLEPARLVVTLEEHSVIGGLGSAVAEYFSARRNHPPVLRLGMPDGYCKAGSYPYMLKQCGLTPEQIAERVKERI